MNYELTQAQAQAIVEAHEIKNAVEQEGKVFVEVPDELLIMLRGGFIPPKIAPPKEEYVWRNGARVKVKK